MSTAPKKKIPRNWTKPTQISKHLFCSICTDVFRDPIRLFCTHTFCRECIQSWMNTRTTCPECRQTVIFELTTEDRLAAKIIDDFEVSCVNKLCDWKDSLEHLEKHAKTCPFEKEVPNWIKALKSDSIKIDEKDDEVIFGTEKDALYEKLNEEMPKGNLTARLLKKDTKILNTLKSIVSNEGEQNPSESKMKPQNSKSLKELESVFTIDVSDDDDESDHNKENHMINSNKGEQEPSGSTKKNVNISLKKQSSEMSSEKLQVESTRHSIPKANGTSHNIDIAAFMDDLDDDDDVYEIEARVFKERNLNSNSESSVSNNETRVTELKVSNEAQNIFTEVNHDENLSRHLKDVNKSRRGGWISTGIKKINSTSN